MMFSTMLLAPLALLATATPVSLLETRQEGAAFFSGPIGKALMGALIPAQKSFKIESGQDFPPSIPRQGAKRARYWYGPYQIRALNATTKFGYGNSFSKDPAGTAWNYIGEDLPRDVTLLSAKASVVYADGSVIGVNTGLYSHHIVINDISKPPPTIAKCPNGKGAEPPGFSVWAGSSEDVSEDNKGSIYTTADGLLNSGYYVGKNDKVIMGGDIVNYTNETKTVYTLIDVQYIDGKPEGLQEAIAQFWNVGQCEGNGFNIPEHSPGQTKFAVKSPSLTMVQDGTFFAFRGHMHEGGTNMVATVNGQEVCNSGAIYGGISTSSGEKGTITAMQNCYKSIKVKKGDNVTLEANYDLELHPPRMQHGGGHAGEMALMTISFAADPTTST